MRVAPLLSAMAAISLFAAPVVAAADEEPKPTQASGGEEKKAKPKKICKQVANTGFRTAARKCKTKEEWDAEEAQAVTDMDIRAKGNY
ncbi:MAG: hypothetical protein KJZ64_03485 [Sphingomonadaceae bacterium]|nr:hypothetical protein [Sphingomonadaceae bacterium]